MRPALRAVPVLLLLASLGALLIPRRAQTVPLYAARTGFQCRTCHFDPNGGGPRNEFGFAYVKNRHDLVPETGNEWGDLQLVNRVGDQFPLYVGVNQRFMLLTTTSVKSDSLDRFGFFSMENALHLTFQPHRRLTLVYTRDGFNSASRVAEAFGMITGFPEDGYLKAGRIRNPFGLRLDDHTVATRQGYLDFSSGQSVLPFDPRESDMGLEAGADHGGWFGRVAFTNGGVPAGANVFAGQYAETKTLKLGYNMSHYQGAVSLYDNYQKKPFGPRRATRWGYYALSHAGPFAFLGEIVAGTDDLGGRKRNALGYFAEADYRPARPWNFRLRYDRMVPDRSSDAAVRKANTHDRYAVEGEYDPVPFAQIRWTLRLIDHRDEAAFGFKDERQAYVQFHFIY